MKKIILLAMLAVSTVSLTSCINNNDDYYDAPQVQNVGKINYLGKTFSLNNAVVSDIEQKDGGYYYGVELSTNEVPQNGKLTGSYLYLEIFQRSDLSFTGSYVAGNKDRGLDYIEYFENPTINNYQPVTGSGSLEIYGNNLPTGSVYLENYYDNYNRDLLKTNFNITDINGNTLSGDFDGLFQFIQKYNKTSAAKAKVDTTNRVITGKRRGTGR